ncbi:MAG: hypothetical protein ACREN6_11790 [Gemmatimonadaceae bacterium]
MNVPSGIEFPQELVDVYVPAILELVTPVAVPEMVTVHGGSSAVVTVMVKVRVEPENVPETTPVNDVSPAWSLAVAVPETVDPDWVSASVRNPLPVSSDAAPWYVPDTVTGPVVESLREQAENAPAKSRINTVRDLRNFRLPRRAVLSASTVPS